MNIFKILTIGALVLFISCEETDDTNSRRNAPIVTGREARGHTEQALQDMTEKAIYLDTAKIPEETLFLKPVVSDSDTTTK